MSFAVIRSTAYSALMTSQVQMQVTASNIANADTEGYTRKIATQVSTVASGFGTGTEITSITSTVDKYLLEDIATAASALGAAMTNDGYADSLQNLLGSTSGDEGSGTSLGNTITSFESALSSLAGTPESKTLKAATVDALDVVASQLRETSSAIQGLRADADDEIANSIETVNSALNTITDLNKQITLAQAQGQPTADLEDQRNTALQGIARQMDVKYYVNSDGQMRVYTASGTPLVDSQVHELSYSSAALAAPGTVFDPITVGGKDITSEITSGTIGALVDQRDGILPAAQAQLDELASELAEAMNDVHNSGTAVPPPSMLIGTSVVSEDDVFSGSGSVRFAATDSEGALVSYQDLDLEDYATVGDLVDAVDAIDGFSASIDTSGHLIISTTSGVAIADMDVAIGANAQGLSDYFGLNDLVTGTGAATIAVRRDILATPGLLAVATLSTASDLAAGDVVLTGGSALVQQAGSALSGAHGFDAAGGLQAMTTSFADYAAEIVSGIATDAAQASSTLTNRETAYQTLSDAISSQSGVNVDEETARLAELEQQYSIAAQLLTTLNSMFEALLEAARSA
jgi:flagellar hook-associated protein 1 FlgK